MHVMQMLCPQAHNTLKQYSSVFLYVFIICYVCYVKIEILSATLKMKAEIS